MKAVTTRQVSALSALVFSAGMVLTGCHVGAGGLATTVVVTEKETVTVPTTVTVAVDGTTTSTVATSSSMNTAVTATESASETTKTDPRAKTVTVSWIGSGQDEIIARIWVAALKKKKIDVTLGDPYADMATAFEDLRDGRVDILPVHLGDAAVFLAKQHGSELPPPGTDADKIKNLLKKNLSAGIATGQMAPAVAHHALVVLPAFAAAHDLDSIGDLVKLDTVTIADSPTSVDVILGSRNLGALYGLTKKQVMILPAGRTEPEIVDALVKGTVDVAVLDASSPAFASDGTDVHVVTLKDPQQLILPQNVLPLMKGKKVDGDSREIIKAITAALDTDSIYEMNSKNVGPEKVSPEILAQDFVDAHTNVLK